MLGAHGLLTKGIGTVYEEVYGIPLIVAGPGVTARGEIPDAQVGLHEVGITLLDMLGLPPLPEAQGQSFQPVLAGSYDPAEFDDSYGEFFGQRFVYTQRITWHGDWKYVFSPGGIDELYNLADDPHEMTNLAADPAHEQTLKDMCRRMWRKIAAIGDESLKRTHYGTLRTAPVGPEDT